MCVTWLVVRWGRRGGGLANEWVWSGKGGDKDYQ